MSILLSIKESLKFLSPISAAKVKKILLLIKLEITLLFVLIVLDLF